jgi:hypothetical protein
MAKKNRFYAIPKEGDIVGFCGKCHQDLSDFYISSVHGVTESLTCIDCHGSHAIRRISTNIINQEKCTGCHDYESAEKLKIILQQLHEQFHTIDAKLKTVDKFPTLAVQNDLDNIWKQLRKVRMISHTFDLDQIEDEAGKVKVSLAKTVAQIDRLAEQDKSRVFWGLIMIFVFLVLGGLTYLFNKEIPNN